MSTHLEQQPDAELHHVGGTDQSLAIGLYIGSLVVIIGLMLTGYGLFGGHQLAQDGSDTNKDLVWGVVMLFVGVVTLALAWFSPRRRAAVLGSATNRNESN